MDVMKINKTTFQSEGLVDGWTSKVWTERHSQLGDFQFKTPYIEETRNLIPEGSLIAIRGSDEVCMVDTHSVTRDDKGARELTTVGRSLEGFLDNRVLTGPWKEPWQIPGQYTVQDALMMLIWNSIVNTTVNEVIRDYHWDHLARDIIPNVIVTDSTKALKAVVPPGTHEDLQTVFDWWYDVGSLYPKVQEFLTLGNLGIRIIRPVSYQISGGTKIITNVANGALDTSPKIITKTTLVSTDKLRFDIYNGRNRTRTSATDTPLDTNTPVVFSYLADHLDNPEYLYSVKDKKTTVHVQSPFQSVEIYAGETGLDLYMEYLAADDLDDSLSTEDYSKALQDKAWAEWKRRKTLRMIDGSISASAPWQYGSDYYLGDLVTLLGEDGIETKKMVSEYIRTEDKNGERAYPTLIDPP